MDRTAVARELCRLAQSLLVSSGNDLFENISKALRSTKGIYGVEDVTVKGGTVIVYAQANESVLKKDWFDIEEVTGERTDWSKLEKVGDAIASDMQKYLGVTCKFISDTVSDKNYVLFSIKVDMDALRDKKNQQKEQALQDFEKKKQALLRSFLGRTMGALEFLLKIAVLSGEKADIISSTTDEKYAIGLLRTRRVRDREQKEELSREKVEVAQRQAKEITNIYKAYKVYDALDRILRNEPWAKGNAEYVKKFISIFYWRMVELIKQKYASLL